MKFVVFLGMPGTGKGTQCRLLNQRDGILSLSPGEIIRDKLSKDAEIAKKINNGDLLSDEFIMNLVADNLNDISAKNDSNKVLIFDGIPRTIGQSAMLNDLLLKNFKSYVSLVVCFTVKKRFIINRLMNRVICDSCGAPGRASKNFTCDACGSKVFKRRVDDDISVIRKRLFNNKKNTDEIYNFYVQNNIRCIKLNADSNANSVYSKLKNIVCSSKI